MTWTFASYYFKYSCQNWLAEDSKPVKGKGKKGRRGKEGGSKAGLVQDTIKVH
jgi:hypothetical protein